LGAGDGDDVGRHV